MADSTTLRDCSPSFALTDFDRMETTVSDQFDACLAFTVAQEGGYVDDPADPGGAT